MNGQLTLHESLEPDRVRGAAGVGLAHGIADGPAKLLAALVKRGLRREALHEAARLVLAWDALAPADPDFRICVCGCGRSLKDRRITARYFDGACRAKALRARKAATPTRTPKNADVTVPGLPSGLSEAA